MTDSADSPDQRPRRNAPSLDPHAAHPHLERLLAIIARLRAPDGCPWDRKQTPQTMAPHLLEECYEALEALETTTDHRAQREELGDVLMNVVLIAQIARENGAFDLEDIAQTVGDKLVRRHPHVFADAAGADQDRAGPPLEHPTTADDVLQNWESIKRRERGGDAEPRPEGQHRMVLAGVPTGLPALLQGLRVGEKAARVGFDWPDPSGPRAKVDEELAELDEALAGGDPARIEHELGDVLFAMVSVARHAGVHPELALRATLQRFRRRFAAVEAAFGAALEETPLAEMEAVWQRAKGGEAPPSSTDG